MPKAKDYTGQKHNQLTFIRSTGKGRGKCRNIIWEAICDCGKIAYVRPYEAVSGRIQSCGHLHDEEAKRRAQQNRKFHPSESSARSVWGTCYKDCDFDIFMALSQEPCYYCHSPPHRTYNRAHDLSSVFQKEAGNFTWTGIDRLDSSIGHVIGNIVPCCTTCNTMKLDLGVEEFLLHIVRISDRIMRLHGSEITHIDIDVERFLAEARTYVSNLLANNATESA